MTGINITIAAIGFVVFTAGLAYAIRIHVTGGTPIHSRRWYTAVIVSAVGCALMVSSFLPRIIMNLLH